MGAKKLTSKNLREKMGAKKLTSENLREKTGANKLTSENLREKNENKITHFKKSNGKKWEQNNSPQKI